MRPVYVGVWLTLLASPPALSLQCRHWADVLVQSFVSKRSDPAAFKQLFAISADQYKQERVSHELEAFRSDVARAIPGHLALPRLRQMLREFYRVGAELYGVQLDAEKVYVVPDMEINAFATGSQVFVHEGLLLYFSDPLRYLARTGQIPRNLSRDDYARLAFRFDWKNDSDSIDFVVAHEAAHNLMAHGDEGIFSSVQSQIQRLARDAKSYREAIANGKTGTGFKHYLGQSLLGFLAGPERSRKKVAQEEEADAVAVDILRRIGLDPRAGLVWQERMDRLYGPSKPTGWTGIITSVFCSTHPDSTQRRFALRRNLDCLGFRGKLCEEHIAFPVPNQLDQLRHQFEQVEDYLEDTIAIAEGRKAPDPGQQSVEIKPNPKDARLLIDGTPITQTKTTLATGRHLLTAAREGYRPIQIRFVVFPDTKSTLKFKLKKCDKREPCETALPVEETNEADAPEEADSNDNKRPYLRRKL